MKCPDRQSDRVALATSGQNPRLQFICGIAREGDGAKTPAFVGTEKSRRTRGQNPRLARARARKHRAMAIGDDRAFLVRIEFQLRHGDWHGRSLCHRRCHFVDHR